MIIIYIIFISEIKVKMSSMIGIDPYLIKRAGIGILNITTILLWDLLLFISAIFISIAQTNLNSLVSKNPAFESLKNRNLSLMIALWVLFVLFIPLSYLGSGNPYSNAGVLGFATLIALINLILGIIFLIQLNETNVQNSQVDTVRNCYIALIVISILALIIYLIYIPISVIKYKKSGGLSADITKTVGAVATMV
jgi:hypothetical protein